MFRRRLYVGSVCMCRMNVLSPIWSTIRFGNYCTRSAGWSTASLGFTVACPIVALLIALLVSLSLPCQELVVISTNRFLRHARHPLLRASPALVLCVPDLWHVSVTPGCLADQSSRLRTSLPPGPWAVRPRRFPERGKVCWGSIGGRPRAAHRRERGPPKMGASGFRVGRSSACNYA